MNKVNLKEIFKEKKPGYLKKYPKFLSKLIIKFLEQILHTREINYVIEKYNDKKGFEFIEELFEYLDFGYLLSSKDRSRIPSEGKLICVANHPLGGLDGLSILKAVGGIRHDVKIVVNDILMNLENLRELFLPYNILSNKAQRNEINGIKEALLNEEAIIFFPAAEVSRLGIRGIHDKTWLKGPTYFARKYQVPILPVYVKAKNTLFFYFMSLIHKSFSIFFLPRELFKKRSNSITLKIGDPIPAHVFKTNLINSKVQTRLLKKHVYQIGRNKEGVFKTEKAIIHPVDRRLLKNELNSNQLLTIAPDGKKLFMVEYQKGKNVIREISRLRELTFRKVGEGTGFKCDIDHYDKHYKHIVLWDEDALEIAGAYRLGLCKEIIENHGKHGIYNDSLFHFLNEFNPYLMKAIELGRSFIQQRYWKSNALDSLWRGIGALLFQRDDIQYLFGGVSISDNYSNDARNLLVYFYRKWYKSDIELAISKNRYILTREEENEVKQLLNSENYNEDFKTLKLTLKNYGYTIPVLFRQYSELCEREGVKFLDFGVDEDFSNTCDGLILLDLAKLKTQKKERYYPQTNVIENKMTEIIPVD